MIDMVYGLFHQAAAILLLFSQFATILLGGPFVVRCMGTDGHEAIEFALTKPCEVEASSVWNENTFNAEVDLVSESSCVDTPLIQSLAIQLRDEHLTDSQFLLLATFSVESAAEISSLVKLPVPAQSLMPGSARSLIRSVILRI